jgi:hypothetical protein
MGTNNRETFYYRTHYFVGGMAAFRGGGVVNVPYGRQKVRDLTSFAGESGQVPADQVFAFGSVCRKQVRQASLKRNGNREHENAKCFIVSNIEVESFVGLAGLYGRFTMRNRSTPYGKAGAWPRA